MALKVQKTLPDTRMRPKITIQHKHNSKEKSKTMLFFQPHQFYEQLTEKS